MTDPHLPPPPDGFEPTGFGPTGMGVGERPAEFGPRLVAYVIDIAIGMALSIPPFVLLVIAFIIGGGFGALVGIVSALLWFALFLAFLYVYIMGMAIHGQTPGKRMQGIRVIQDSGAPLGLGGSVIRWLVAGVLNSVIGVPIGSLWMLWDPEKKTAYDKLLSNRAITVEKGSILPFFPDGKPF